MQPRSLVVLALLLLLAIFAASNWAVITAPTRVDLLFAEVVAPLGLILIGFVALLVLAFSAWVIRMQVAALREARRQAEELRRQRELADEAEASRFTELRGFIERELADVRKEIATAANSLSAYVGEVDDKLERRLAPLPPDRQP